MKILFIHVSRNISVEYGIHKMFAEYADSEAIDSFFFWQDNTDDRSRNTPASLSRLDRNYYFDLGRNLSITPKPSRLRRALMMAFALPRSLPVMTARIAKIKPDVLYTSQQHWDVLLGHWFGRLFKIPHIIHIHYPVGPWLGTQTMRVIIMTPRLLAPSDFIRQGAIAKGVAPEHIHTIYNPTELERFNIPRNTHAIRDEFQLPHDALIVTAAGRLDPSKGHLELIKAFAQVHERLPNAYLLICGKTFTRDGYDKVLRDQVEQLNMKENIIFTGFRHDIPAIFSATNVFCLPTQNEAFGLVFTEAMAAGLPVVACSSGGVTEIVKHNETGLLSPLGAVNEIADNLFKLLSDEDLAQQMGRAGRARVFSKFPVEKLTSQWVTLLQKLVPAVG